MVEDIKPEEKDVKPLNIVEEAKLIRDEILKQKKEVKQEREKLERIKSEAYLSGDTGGNIKPKYSAEEAASRVRIKAVGKVIGAGWAKNYDD